MENEIIMCPADEAAEAIIKKWNDDAAKLFPMTAEERAKVEADWEALLAAMEG